MAEIGERAPDFMLVDQNQKQVTLGQYKGDKNVVSGRVLEVRGERYPGTGY